MEECNNINKLIILQEELYQKVKKELAKTEKGKRVKIYKLQINLSRSEALISLILDEEDFYINKSKTYLIGINEEQNKKELERIKNNLKRIEMREKY